MPRIAIEAADASLGAVVAGVRLAELASEEWREIAAAFLEHAVLVFPGQHLSGPQQVAFARRFGEIEHLTGDTGWTPISNRRADGRLLADDEPAMQVMRGNEGWHTDSSYMPLAAKASVLSAQVVPGSGGETEWADMRAAYDALDAATREWIAPLAARHSLVYSQARIGHTDANFAGYGFNEGEPPLRPLVKTHPVTGRKSLFIGRHAHAIPGLAPGESRQFLDELLSAACLPPRVWTHAWQAGDVAVWDNRCVLHRARPYDHSEARVLRHVRIAGDPASERAAA